jgi:hypothetical protein
VNLEFLVKANLSAKSSVNDVQKVLTKCEKALAKGHGDAGFILGCLFDPDNTVLSDTVRQAIGATHEKSRRFFEEGYSQLMREALAGNGRSMHLIAIYYQGGTPPVSCDLAQYEHWKQKAIAAGYRGAGQL